MKKSIHENILLREWKKQVSRSEKALPTKMNHDLNIQRIPMTWPKIIKYPTENGKKGLAVPKLVYPNGQ